MKTINLGDIKSEALKSTTEQSFIVTSNFEIGFRESYLLYSSFQTLENFHCFISIQIVIAEWLEHELEQYIMQTRRIMTFDK